VCLEYHIFHYPGPTFILVGVHLCTLLKGIGSGESLKMAVGQQILLTSFACAVNHAAEDKLEEDVADYFSPAEEEVEFRDLEQEINPETPPVELKQLPPGLQYAFLNGDRETPVIISDKLSHEETQKLVATLEKYQPVIRYSLRDLKGISSSMCTHRIPMD
jgi:hypothetical protein